MRTKPMEQDDADAKAISFMSAVCRECLRKNPKLIEDYFKGVISVDDFEKMLNNYWMKKGRESVK